jgi:hypothetical protein
LLAADAIRMLEEDTPDRRPTMDMLRREAPIRALTAALREARRPLTRHLLCDLLGFRMARSAIPELLDALGDSDRGVRCAAADAVGKAFGYPRRPPRPRLVAIALPVLLQQWDAESTPEVRSVLATSLGLIGDASACSRLERALNDPDKRVRDGARWALDRLKKPRHSSDAE